MPVAPLSMFDQTANPIEASGFNPEAGHGLLHQAPAAYMNYLNVVPDLDIRTILPVVIETGIDQFIKPFNQKNFWIFFNPDPENALYDILRWLIVETYKQGGHQFFAAEGINSKQHISANDQLHTMSFYLYLGLIFMVANEK